jgi:Eukaryotic aspartyl protease
MKIFLLLAVLFNGVFGDCESLPAPVPIQRPPCSVSAFDRAYRTKMMLAVKYMFNSRTEKDAILNQLMRLTSTGPKTIPLINQDNDSFLVPVILASGQAFNIDIDTGSSDTWFRGPNCTATDGPCVGTAVNATDTGLELFRLAFTTSYGSGSVVGQIAKANVTVGDNTAVVIPVGISRRQNGLSPSDGILGLGFDTVSSISKKLNENANYMDALHSTTGEKSSVAFHLSTDPTTPGSIVFGDVEKSKFVGPFTTVPVNSPLYWQFDFSSSTFKIGESHVLSLSGRFQNAIVDSGTSLMIIDSKIADYINMQIGAVPTNTGDGMARFTECEVGLRGPTFTMNIAGADYLIPPSIYVVKNAGDCFSGFAGMGSTPEGQLLADAASLPMAILGGTFMKAVYVNFDRTDKKLHFAQSVNGISTQDI